MSFALIGITSEFAPDPAKPFGQIALGESYVQAVVKAGGLPVAIPVGMSAEQEDALFARLDGILFSGGSDLAPELFGGQAHPRIYGIDARRDELEIRYVRRAVETGKPFLGICRGIQSVNVALGGTLFTDLHDQHDPNQRHDWYPDIPRDYLAHAVTLEPDSRLAQILGKDALEVNSLHHQGIERVAPALRAVAYAPDHLVEAVEVPQHPFGFAVQWHPEWLQAYAPQRQLFQAFLQAAASGRE
jgi:putative glutamine amidotransferase